jgi:hypothetical protein
MTAKASHTYSELREANLTKVSAISSKSHKISRSLTKSRSYKVSPSLKSHETFHFTFVLLASRSHKRRTQYFLKQPRANTRFPKINMNAKRPSIKQHTKNERNKNTPPLSSFNVETLMVGDSDW